jgi:translation initiation factor IF-3
VSVDGEQIGIKTLPDALALARDADLDLVEVAPQANPPVCRIMDYGKFKYEAAQKAKESRRKTTQVSIKEMKYRVKIGRGDFDTKTTKVQRFLEEGHKVKITIMFRGREVHHPELGMRILDRVAEHNNELARVEASPKLDGRNMTMVLAPDKRVQAAAEAARKKAVADERQAERRQAEFDQAATVSPPDVAVSNGSTPAEPSAEQDRPAEQAEQEPTAVSAADEIKE